MKKDSLRERAQLKQLLKDTPRSPKQLNKLFTSDVEILKTPSGYLAISTDSLSQEIAIQLYRSHFLQGWMAVMNSVSDLAASGTEPLGLVMSTEWARGSRSSERAEIQRGINAALRKAKVALLGGDQGTTHQHHVLTSTILGQSKQRPLDRLGIRPGDLLFLAQPGKLGIGPALALRYLDRNPGARAWESLFRPSPSCQLMQQARTHAVASIDTSDGLFTSLAILSELNRVGFEFQPPPQLFAPAAKKYCLGTKRSSMLLAMMELGDLQTLVACRPAKADFFLRRPKDWVKVGQANSKVSILTCLSDRGRALRFTTRLFTGKNRDAEEIRFFIKEMNQRLLR